MSLKNTYAGICSAFAATLLAGAATAQEPIKLGVILPISGGAAYVGQGIGDGVRLAVKEINDAGGVKGRKLEILLRDEQLKPDVSLAAAKELISKDGVKLFIGPATSATGLAVSELAKEEKVVNISPSAKTEAITGEKLHDYIFQLAPTTDIDGVRSVEILKKMGAKSICFTGFDYAYTKDWFKSIRANMGSDFTEAGEFLVPINATDYSATVTQLIANSCDTVIGTMYGGGFISFVKQATPFGLFQSKKLLWGSNTGDYAVAKALGADFPEGMWASSADIWYYEGSDEHKKYQEGLAALQGRKETDMWPITGYNAVKFLAAAIEKAGTDEPKAVRDALEGLTISSPLGELTIDPKTHRAGSPEFYGQVATVPGETVKRLTNVQLVR